MPWQKNYDETQVLEKAMRAFWAHGYEATSMNDLVEATGINRGSIYAAFPNKHALFMRALEYYDRVYREQHLQRLAAEHEPLETIFAVFESAAGKPSGQDLPWGCLVVNTALELSPHDPQVGKFVDRSLRAVEQFFQSRLDDARRQGQLSHDMNTATTAKSLLGLFLGLRVITRAQMDQSTSDAIISQARMMLE